MKRNPRKVRWTKAFRKAAGKEMVIVCFCFFSSVVPQRIYHSQDSTIDFEKRRNVPVRYDRDLMQTTLHAMKRVAVVKKRREHAFWKNRYVMKLSRRKEANNVQDGHESGKTQSSSAEEVIGKSNFCSFARANSRCAITREDQNKNQVCREA
jgi:Ribosomal protein L24e